MRQKTSATILSDRSTDDELAALAAAGNSRAFELIMRRHNRLLFRSARSILKSDAETEDALQEAYLKAWRALPAFRSEARLSTWLTRIVINEALGRTRRKGAEVISLAAPIDTPDQEADVAAAESENMAEDNPDDRPESAAMRAQVRLIMESRIDALPQPFRTVFILRAVEEMSAEEVAQVLEIPEATVRTRLFRAKSLLREGLSRDLDMAVEGAFSFDGSRCDRIVASVLARLA
ncbi:MAG TPA: RNA polymerase sigma factor [Burkholderiales bacterium]|nr:RNA polymerase sigma factor [Burkholderiales bacterium]